MPTIQKYYPPLSDLVDVSTFPGNITSLEDFIQQYVDTILGKVYYKDLAVDIKDFGNTKIYNLVILSRELKIPIVDEISIVLFKGSDTNLSEFPVIFEWSWPLYRYADRIDLQNLAETPEIFLEIFLELAQIGDKKEFLDKIVETFLDNGDDTYSTFLDNISSSLSTYDNSVAAVTTEIQTIQTSLATLKTELTSLLTSTNLFTLQNLYATYESNSVLSAAVSNIQTSIENLDSNHNIQIDFFNDIVLTLLSNISDIDEKFQNLVYLFQNWIADITREKINEFLIPQFYFELTNVNVALEFPRSILKPIDPITDEVYIDTEIKSSLIFNIGSTSISSLEGFNYDIDPSISFTKSQIGNTGLTLEFTGAKVDLSDTTNIPEADEDGRPVTFKGVYIESAVIELPAEWVKDGGSSGVSLQGDNLLIGSVGGISGDINFTGVIPFTLLGLDITLTRFFINFHQNSVIESAIGGNLTIPGLKEKGTSTDKILDFELSYAGDIGSGEETYAIRVSSITGVEVEIPGVLVLRLYDLTIGKENGAWFVEIGPLDDGTNTGKTLGAFLEHQLNIPVISKVLPESVDFKNLKFKQGIGLDPANTDIVIGWPDLDGINLSTSQGNISAEIDVHKTILNTITINKVSFGFSTMSSGGTEVKAGVDGGIQLGPISGVVSGFGIKAELTFPSGGGNLGPLDINNFKLYGPSGIGLSIDGGAIKGGGFLDFSDGRYSGALELKINEVITVSAVGIIDTKIAGPNPPEYALLIVLSAEFSGLQLGFGFTLSGIGGLLALHRTMNVGVLQAGVKTGALNNILFPTNVVENAPQIISDLDAAFPISQGRFVFGPMAKIGWGTPSLITVDLGILIEIPSPVRLALLGVIRVILPDELAPVIKIQINFLGVIDFGKKSISFDASLFDSRLVAYTLSGDMAFRLLYGDNPAFLLTVGGFNPSFEPPPLNLPKLDRLTVSLKDTAEFKLSIENYFAVTSNTVQFGSRVDFYAKVGVITAEGFLAFDAIFYFSPFSFTADLSAAIGISYKSHFLAAITLNGKLSGPTPWRISGDASFKILKIKKTFTLQPKEFGKKETIVNDTISIEPLVVAALTNVNNWETKIAEDSSQVVQFKENKDPNVNTINGEGYITVTQKIVPLDLTIDKYGNKEVTGSTYFSIASMSVDGVAYTTATDLTNTVDDFAPAEYKNISKTGKLSSPSFEKMNNGVKLKVENGGFDYGNAIITKSLGYEQILLDVTLPDEDTLIRAELRKAETTLQLTSQVDFENQSQGSSSYRSQQGKDNIKKAFQAETAVGYNESQYGVVFVDDLSPYDTGISSLGAAASASASQPSTRNNKVEAQELLDTILAENPRLKGRLQVIKGYEMPKTESFVYENDVFEDEVYL